MKLTGRAVEISNAKDISGAAVWAVAGGRTETCLTFVECGWHGECAGSEAEECDD